MFIMSFLDLMNFVYAIDWLLWLPAGFRNSLKCFRSQSLIFQNIRLHEVLFQFWSEIPASSTVHFSDY